MPNSMFFWEAAAAKFPATAAPAFVFTAGTNFAWTGLAFSGAATEACFFTGVIPAFYTATGGITWGIYWIPASGCSAADKVRWDVTIIGRSNDETWDTATADAANASDVVTAGVDADLHVIFPTVASTSLAPGDVTMVKIQRDHDHADDNMAEDALLIGLQLLET